MHFSRWTASLWPGFARAWVLGRWDGLVLAAAFAAALNFALVMTFGFRPWPPGPAASIAWALVLGLWTVGLVLLRYDWPLLGMGDGDVSPDQDVLFREAQHEYLKEHWLEAESTVARILANQPMDVEARLLVASIQRRTGRWNEARKTLVELQGEARAVPWLLEIEVELRQIEESRLVHRSKAA